MFNIVFCLAVPHSRRQRLAASQVTSPRDTCGARAPRDTDYGVVEQHEHRRDVHLIPTPQLTD